MNILDCYFSGYKFYRKMRKGEWWLVSPRTLPEIRVWVNNVPTKFERIYQHEFY